jgi:hypothetical protein
VRAFSFAFAAALGCAVPALAAAGDAPAAASQEPLDEQELALARTIVAAMMPADRQEQMFIDAMEAMNSQSLAAATAKIDDPGVKKIIRKYVDDLPDRFRPVIRRHLPEITEAVARAYAREFTLAELQDIAAFAQTPSGARYLSRSSAIMSDPDFAAANSKLTADALASNEKNMAAMAQEITAYKAAREGKKGGD